MKAAIVNVLGIIGVVLSVVASILLPLPWIIGGLLKYYKWVHTFFMD